MYCTLYQQRFPSFYNKTDCMHFCWALLFVDISQISVTGHLDHTSGDPLASRELVRLHWQMQKAYGEWLATVKWWLHVHIVLSASMCKCVLWVFSQQYGLTFSHRPYSVGTLCGPSKVMFDSRVVNMLPLGEATLYIYSLVYCCLLACHVLVLVHHQHTCCQNSKHSLWHLLYNST